MAPKQLVRICMVGAGQLARYAHYPSLASFDDVEIAGVSDMNKQALEEVGEMFGIPSERRYHAEAPDSYRRMIDEIRPDGVYAIGQPHIMYDVWVWCLEQGSNLFIEKPMGITMHQARSLTYLAEKHKCITQVGHQRRSAPIMVRMREKCLARGPITHAVCEFYKFKIEPRVAARDYMMDDCVHSIDTLRWMCGGEAVSVESHCKRVGVPDINWIGAMVRFDNGSVGTLINSWSSGRRVFRAQMHAPGVYCDVELEDKARLYADGDYDGVEFDTREVAGSDEKFVYGGFQAKNREFIDSLKSGKESTSSPFRDAVKTMDIAETILAQSHLRAE